MYQEVYIVPNLMVKVDMCLKAFIRVPVQVLSVEATDEAHVLHVVVLEAGLLSQLGERVDDDTEDDVEEDDDDDQVE